MIPLRPSTAPGLLRPAIVLALAAVSVALLGGGGAGRKADAAAPTPTPSPTVAQLPIHLVYVNHVEVESVIQYVGPLVDGTTYTATQPKYTFTSGQLEWEMAQAEAVGARISFHMSGAYAERAMAAGAQALWAQHLA